MVRFVGFSFAAAIVLGFLLSLVGAGSVLSTPRGIGATIGACLTIFATGLIFGGLVRWLRRRSAGMADGYFSALVSMLIIAGLIYVGASN